MKSRETAQTIWSLLLQKASASKESYILIAKFLKEQGYEVDAHALSENAEQEFLKFREVLSNSAEAAMKKKDYQDALKKWELIISFFPLFPNAYTRKAVALRFLGHLEEADILLEEATKKFPPIQSMLHTHADTAMDRRDYLAAIARWDSLCEHFPNFLQAYIRKAVALIALNQLNEAELFLEKSLEKFPFAENLMIAYANIAMSKKDYLTAEKRWSIVRKHYPSCELAYSQSLLASRLLGKNEEAIKIALQLQQIQDTVKVGGGNERLAVLKMRIAADSYRNALITQGKPAYPRRGTHEPIRVAFIINSISQREHLTPIYEQMHNDVRFHPFIVAYNFHTQKETTYSFFRKLYPAEEGHEILGSETDTEPAFLYDLEPDITFLQRPYSKDYPKDYSPDILSLYTRIAYTAYGIIFSLGASNPTVYSNDLTPFLWRYFAESSVHARYYVEKAAAENIVAFGSPKVDLFRKCLANRKSDDKIHVLWNAHFNSKNFIRYFDAMLDISSFETVSLTVRPHPLMRRIYDRNGTLSTAKFDSMINSFISKGALFSDGTKGETYVDELMHADILISDLSSLILEHSVTTNPTVFLCDEEHDKRWMGDFTSKYINEYCYPVSSGEELKVVLRTLMSSGDYKKSPRLEYLKEINLIPPYSIAEKMCDYLAGQVDSEAESNSTS